MFFSYHRLLLPVIVSFFLFSTPIHSATFQAGTAQQKTSFHSSNKTENDSLTEEEIEQFLWSNKSYEIRAAIKAIASDLNYFTKNSDKFKKYVDRIISLLGSSSPNIRFHAEHFIKKYAPLLTTKLKVIDEVYLSELSQKSYISEVSQVVFLNLLNQILHPELSKTYLKEEYLFQTLNGFTSENSTLQEISKNILIHNMNDFIKKNLWKKTQTKNFLMQFEKANDKGKLTALSVLESLIPTWVAHDLIEKDDLLAALTHLQSEDLDFQEKFVEFFSTPKVIKAVKKLNLFERKWVEKLKQDIKNGHFSQKQTSLNVISYLMKPFVQSGSFYKKDFTEIWNHITKNLSDYESPFNIVYQNMDSLLKSGWFNRRNYEMLLTNFDKRNSQEQASILEFLNTNYPRFEMRQWISATPLIPILFSENKDTDLKMLKLEILYNHPDLVNEKQIFSRKELKEFLPRLHSRNSQEFSLVIGIIDAGFDAWTKQKILDKKFLQQILSAEPSHGHAAKILQVMKHHFDHNLDLFDKKILERIAEFALSPHLDVQRAVKEFFKQHYALLKNEKLIRGDIRRILKQTGLWNEIIRSS